MILVALLLLGLCLGSFVNALVWRVHVQASKKYGVQSTESRVRSTKSKVAKVKAVSSKGSEYSVVTGRSMCPHCKHTLAAKDLIPVLSWVWLRGKCRYCHKPIDWQYPAVELLTSFLFVASYVLWPYGWELIGVFNFCVWLVMLVGFMALIVYDLRWMLLPNRIVFPMILLGLLLASVNIFSVGNVGAVYETIMSVAVAGGIFYLLFMISDGRWIGGGDVKLGLLIGLILGDPYLAFLVLLTASTLGTLVVLPGMMSKKLSATSHIPFGPFLIVATIIVQLFGTSVIEWYKSSLLLVG